MQGFLALFRVLQACSTSRPRPHLRLVVYTTKITQKIWRLIMPHIIILQVRPAYQPTVTVVTLLGPRQVEQPWRTNFVKQRSWRCCQSRDSSPFTEFDNTRVPLDQQPSSILSHKNPVQTLTSCFLTSIWILLNIGFQSGYFFQVLRIKCSVHRPPMSPLPLDLYTPVSSGWICVTW